MGKKEQLQPKKKQKINEGTGSGSGTGHEFVKDGMETAEIRAVVQDIMLYIQENKSKYTHQDILVNLKRDIGRVVFFEERYPMLYQMVTKEEGFEYQSLEYFLQMRENIIKEKITTEAASKEIGQTWFNKYCKNATGNGGNGGNGGSAEGDTNETV
jgi:hypothetical protein